MIKMSIRQQDGSFVEIEVADTDGMRRLARWISVRERSEASHGDGR